MNHLQSINEYGYNFFGLRHGQSEANIDIVEGSNRLGRIISKPEVGTKMYGLTSEGKQQVVDSLTAAKEQGILGPNTFVYTSDFKRALETAQIAKEILNVRFIIATELLRERNFGVFENASSDNYNLIWDIDSLHADENARDVEPVNQVLARTTSLVSRIIKARAPNAKKNQNVLLVSHGDALQILETGFRKTDPRLHRSLPPLQTAEIRQYTSTSLLKN